MTNASGENLLEPAFLVSSPCSPRFKSPSPPSTPCWSKGKKSHDERRPERAEAEGHRLQGAHLEPGQTLSHRLGEVKVLMLENRDRQGDDDPSHRLFFAEAPDRRQGAAGRGYRAADPQAPPRSRRLAGDSHDVPEWER
jgi:hypothetical protein